tara:strand:- start:964 stop:1401 length:438 start_codon:yes stop_codon:yes gene_type:complete
MIKKTSTTKSAKSTTAKIIKKASVTKPKKSTTRKKAGVTIAAVSTTAKKPSKTITPKSTTAVWSVKGVKKETVIAAKKAAKREGVFLGAWVDRILRDAATNKLKEAPVPAIPETDVMTAIAQLSDKVDAMAEKRSLLSRIFSKAA